MGHIAEWHRVPCHHTPPVAQEPTLIHTDPISAIPLPGCVHVTVVWSGGMTRDTRQCQQCGGWRWNGMALTIYGPTHTTCFWNSSADSWSHPICYYTISQSEASIQVTLSLPANQRSVITLIRYVITRYNLYTGNRFQTRSLFSKYFNVSGMLWGKWGFDKSGNCVRVPTLVGSVSSDFLFDNNRLQSLSVFAPHLNYSLHKNILIYPG